MGDDLEAVRIMFSANSPARGAFDYILAHAKAASFRFVLRTNEVRAVELQRPDRKLNPFAIQAHANHINFYLRRPILSELPDLFEAAVETFGPVKPNKLGEYRTHLRNVVEVDAMLAFLRSHDAWPSKKTGRRFVAETFERVTGEHFLQSARQLAAGFKDHPFGPSTDYDLLFDGVRLPPKAVFGVAASAALGFPVKPENFSAGESMVCFRMLRASGYQIVAKGKDNAIDPSLISDEDRTWSEGRPRLVTHLRRERGTGLGRAKRDQFRATHGYLYCERCGMVPVNTFGSAIGEACIEVHHHGIHIAEMDDGHHTRLEDLQCLCANCHRVTHRELKAELTGG